MLIPLSASFGAQAGLRDDVNPYQQIVNRNVFGLESRIPIVTNIMVKVKRPQITLTGFTTILGKKQALMTVDVSGKVTRHCILAEGERDGDIEVLRVNEVAATVEVSQAGTRITLYVRQEWH